MNEKSWKHIIALGVERQGGVKWNEEDEKQPDSQETLRRRTPYGVEEESAKRKLIKLDKQENIYIKETWKRPLIFSTGDLSLISHFRWGQERL